MAQLNDVPAFIFPYKDRKCMFCGKEVTYGAYWSGFNDICVGNCCKRRLIDMYKDIIMETNCGRTDFIYDIKKDIKECYKKAIKSSIHLEKAKAKVNDAQIKEWENELQAIEDDKIWCEDDIIW